MGRKEKVAEYDEGIVDVVTEPIETLNHYRSEMDMCLDIIEELFGLWEGGNYDEMRFVFERIGLLRKIEKGNENEQ